MCNVYRPPGPIDVSLHFRVNTRERLWPGSVHPRSPGPFIRRAVEDTGYSRELVVGQWALIPPWAKDSKLKYSTNNARSEEITSKASYKDVWAKGQRCIIPAANFDEPNWESGKNVWWRFQRVYGRPWALASLWNTWLDRTSGEVHEGNQGAISVTGRSKVPSALLQIGWDREYGGNISWSALASPHSAAQRLIA